MAALKLLSLLIAELVVNDVVGVVIVVVVLVGDLDLNLHRLVGP